MTIVIMAGLIGLLLLLQRWIYQRFWDYRLDMDISFSAPEAIEGDTLELTQQLTNAKALPLPWVNAKFQTSRFLVFPHNAKARISDNYYQDNVFSVGRYERITRTHEFVCSRRGYYRIQSMDLSGSDIFARRKMVKQLRCDAELTVLPQQIPYPDLAVPFRQIYGDIEVQRFTNPDPFAFRGLREYEYQDDFRHINFKASAQTGELMVNIYNATASQELMILLNLEPYSDWELDDVYEESIRLAASVAQHFSDMGLSVGLRSNGRDIFTKNTVEILPGSGSSHAHHIKRTLAHIDLSLQSAPFYPTLDQAEEDEPVYLFISANHGANTVRSFLAMRDRGLQVRWIMPAQPEADIRLPDYVPHTRWEVIAYDTKTSRVASRAG